MAIPHRYQAYWIPLDGAVNQQAQVELCNRWLLAAPNMTPLVVLNTAGAIKNWAFEPIQWVPSVLSTRTKRLPSSSGPYRVVTFRPSPPTLQLARRHALDGEICVIGPYGHEPDSIAWWVDSSGADCLDPNYAHSPRESAVDTDAASQLTSILNWDGNNNFVSSGDIRRITVQDLRQLHKDHPNLHTEDLKEFALRSGLTEPAGAEKLSRMFSMVIEGRNPR